MNRLFIGLAVLILAAACGGRATTGDRQIEVDSSYEDGYTTVIIGQTAWAVPQGMDFQQYPILGRKLTEADVMRMKLRLDVVPAGTVLWNEDHNHRAFWLDTMRKERKVWVDQFGAVVYIEDCGNRAMSPIRVPKCPDRVVCPGPHLAVLGGAAGTGNTPAAALSPDPGGRRGDWDFGWLGDILLFLLGLALLALAVFALAWLIRELVNGYRRGGGVGPRSRPAPIPGVVRPRHFGPRSVQLVFGPVPAPAPPPPPVPVAEFRRFGPFDHISIDDAGAGGYRVTGYNGDQEVPLGTYRWAETENAQDRGEFVIVMV